MNGTDITIKRNNKMRMNTNTLVAAAAVLASALTMGGCGMGSGSTVDMPTWEMKVAERKTGPCPSDTEKCLTMKAEYPVFASGDATWAKTLNDDVMRFVLPQFKYEGENSPGETSIEQSFDAMEGDFKTVLRNELAGTSGWFTEVSVKPESILGGHYLNLKSSVSSFLGGAHPNSFLQLKVYDCAAKSAVDWHDLVTDTTALLALAETKFLAQSGLKAGVNYEAEGYWFAGNRFSLPSNFALTESGFYFYYNAYEVASYAQGSIELSVTFNEAKDILVPGLKKAS
jgi:hypothetical protein